VLLYTAERKKRKGSRPSKTEEALNAQITQGEREGGRAEPAELRTVRKRLEGCPTLKLMYQGKKKETSKTGGLEGRTYVSYYKMEKKVEYEDSSLERKEKQQTLSDGRSKERGVSRQVIPLSLKKVRTRTGVNTVKTGWGEGIVEGQNSGKRKLDSL